MLNTSYPFASVASAPPNTHVDVRDPVPRTPLNPSPLAMFSVSPSPYVPGITYTRLLKFSPERFWLNQVNAHVISSVSRCVSSNSTHPGVEGTAIQLEATGKLLGNVMGPATPGLENVSASEKACTRAFAN